MPSRSLPLSVHAGRSRLRVALSTTASLLPPGAFGLVLLLYDDRPRTCVPMTTTPNGILKIGNSWWRYPLQCPGYGFRQLLLTRNTGAAPKVVSGRSRLPSRRPMQPCPDPLHRLVLSHLECAPGDLDLGPDAPPGDEGVGKGSVREIDRNGVVQNAAGAGGRDGPTLGAAILVQPVRDLGVPLTETARRNTNPDAHRKRRSTAVIISRGLPGISCSSFVQGKTAMLGATCPSAWVCLRVMLCCRPCVAASVSPQMSARSSSSSRFPPHRPAPNFPPSWNVAPVRAFRSCAPTTVLQGEGHGRELAGDANERRQNGSSRSAEGIATSLDSVSRSRKTSVTKGKMLLALCARRPVPHPKGIPEQSPAAPLLTAHVHLTIRPECPLSQAPARRTGGSGSPYRPPSLTARTDARHRPAEPLMRRGSKIMALCILLTETLQGVPAGRRRCPISATGRARRPATSSRASARL
jgi:hypothetical protein